MHRSRPRATLFLASLWALFQALGCGYYSTSATGGTSLKSIAVPLFKNETLEHGLEDPVTRTVVDAFVADNHLEVVSESEAQSILWGTIVGYTRNPFSFDARGTVVEYKLELVATIEYEDRKRAKTIWREEDLRAWATYRLAGTGTSTETPEEGEAAATSEEEARQAAIDKLARELVAKTVGGW